MTDRYVAMLRGINVGRRLVKMSDLQAVFERLGFSEVKTYIRSGNVVFKAGDEDATKLVQTIEERIAVELLPAVSVVLRTPLQLKTIVETSPFLRRGVDPTKLHVTFLATQPEASRIDLLPPDVGLPDEYVLAGREVYLHCPDRYGETKLNNSFWEKKLGVIATTRNWNTVQKLLAMTGE